MWSQSPSNENTTPASISAEIQSAARRRILLAKIPPDRSSARTEGTIASDAGSGKTAPSQSGKSVPSKFALLDSIAEAAASAKVQPAHLKARSLRESAREEAMPQPSGTKTTIHAATTFHLGVVFVCDMRPPSCSFQIDTNWRGNKETPARAGIISLPFRRQFRRIPSPYLGKASRVHRNCIK